MTIAQRTTTNRISPERWPTERPLFVVTLLAALTIGLLLTFRSWASCTPS